MLSMVLGGCYILFKKKYHHLFEEYLAMAETRELKRMNYDLRNTPDDNSQRMLNALMPGTEMPINRHPMSDFGCVVPAEAWHAVEIREPSVIFEAKDGKYGEDGSETLTDYETKAKTPIQFPFSS